MRWKSSPSADYTALLPEDGCLWDSAPPRVAPSRVCQRTPPLEARLAHPWDEMNQKKAQPRCLPEENRGTRSPPLCSASSMVVHVGLGSILHHFRPLADRIQQGTAVVQNIPKLIFYLDYVCTQAKIYLVTIWISVVLTKEAAKWIMTRLLESGKGLSLQSTVNISLTPSTDPPMLGCAEVANAPPHPA